MKLITVMFATIGGATTGYLLGKILIQWLKRGIYK